MKKSDIYILKHIKGYCQAIERSVIRFGEDLNVFEEDEDYRNSVCMNLLQIGELVGHLSEEFKNTNKEIYWPAIKGMRNVFAHEYGNVKLPQVWNTVIKDVPVLLEFCNKTIGNTQEDET